DRRSRWSRLLSWPPLALTLRVAHTCVTLHASGHLVQSPAARGLAGRTGGSPGRTGGLPGRTGGLRGRALALPTACACSRRRRTGPLARSVNRVDDDVLLADPQRRSFAGA